MTSESNRISAASTAYVDGVCRSWGWSWGEMQQADDDGIDGLVYLRTKQVNEIKPNDSRRWKHDFTGGLIHVQIKSGRSYVKARTLDYVEIVVPNLIAKRELWLKSPLPIALIYVKEGELGKTPKSAWWADLKSPDSYSSRGTILVPLKNRFQEGLECRKPFSRLARGQHRKLSLSTIDMTMQGSLPSKLNLMSKGTKAAAIDFYNQWKSAAPKHSELGPITVNRTGWAHITRVGRPVSRILNSFELLPAAARIVSEIQTWKVLRRGPSVRKFKDGSWSVYDYIGVSALVKWPARASSEVMVILRRQTTLTETHISEGSPPKVCAVDVKIWFYSVYEPGRRKQEN